MLKFDNYEYQTVDPDIDRQEMSSRNSINDGRWHYSSVSEDIMSTLAVDVTRNKLLLDIIQTQIDNHKRVLCLSENIFQINKLYRDLRDIKRNWGHGVVNFQRVSASDNEHFIIDSMYVSNKYDCIIWCTPPSSNYIPMLQANLWLLDKTLINIADSSQYLTKVRLQFEQSVNDLFDDKYNNYKLAIERNKDRYIPYNEWDELSTELYNLNVVFSDKPYDDYVSMIKSDQPCATLFKVHSRDIYQTSSVQVLAFTQLPVTQLSKKFINISTEYDPPLRYNHWMYDTINMLDDKLSTVNGIIIVDPKVRTKVAFHIKDTKLEQRKQGYAAYYFDDSINYKSNRVSDKELDNMLVAPDIVVSDTPYDDYKNVIKTGQPCAMIVKTGTLEDYFYSDNDRYEHNDFDRWSLYRDHTYAPNDYQPHIHIVAHGCVNKLCIDINKKYQPDEFKLNSLISGAITMLRKQMLIVGDGKIIIDSQLEGQNRDNFITQYSKYSEPYGIKEV